MEGRMEAGTGERERHHRDGLSQAKGEPHGKAGLAGLPQMNGVKKLTLVKSSSSIDCSQMEKSLGLFSSESNNSGKEGSVVYSE